MSQVYEFKVEMTCEGCSSAVKRILDRNQGNGIDKYEINLAAKTVTIESTLPQAEVQNILEKSGKDVTFVSRQ